MEDYALGESVRQGPQSKIFLLQTLHEILCDKGKDFLTPRELKT